MVAEGGLGVHRKRFGGKWAGSKAEEAAEVSSGISGGRQANEGSDDDTFPKFDSLGTFGHSGLLCDILGLGSLEINQWARRCLDEGLTRNFTQNLLHRMPSKTYLMMYLM